MSRANDALGITARYFFDGVNELVEYADNGTGNGPRSRYYVHGVSYVDERLMMYDDDTDRPYYFVTDRMHNVRVLVDRAGAIRERYAYDPYGRPLIRELCGRGDMNNDTRMTTTPDDSRFAAAKDGSIWDPRADLDDDGDVDGADETAYHNKKPTWSSVMSAPTVSQAFSDFDNPFMFQGVPHFALDTAANATSEQLNLALNHHRARFVDVQTGRWTARDPLSYSPLRLMIDRIFSPGVTSSGESQGATYLFMASNPTRFLDPFGTETCEEGHSTCIQNCSTTEGVCVQVLSALCGLHCARACACANTLNEKIECFARCTIRCVVAAGLYCETGRGICNAQCDGCKTACEGTGADIWPIEGGCANF
jgi:hypothetical protein